MDIPAPGLDVGLQIGDAVDDGHGNFSVTGLSVFPLSSTRPRSAQLSSALYSGPWRGYGLGAPGLAVMCHEKP